MALSKSKIAFRPGIAMGCIIPEGMIGEMQTEGYLKNYKEAVTENQGLAEMMKFNLENEMSHQVEILEQGSDNDANLTKR